MRNESTLQARIARLTDDFARAVFDAVCDSWLSELRGSSPARSIASKVVGRRPTAPLATAAKTFDRARRTPSDDLSGRILEALTDMGTPMASSTIAETLGVQTEALRLSLRSLRANGDIEMHGERRNAVYSLREGTRK